MARTFCRRLLSMVLAMIFVFTTFCFADVGLFANAAVDPEPVVNELAPTITFYAPETIYLNPADWDKTSDYGFKYFVDSTVSGSLNASATQTSGTVYFSITQACSNVTLSCDGGTTLTMSASGTGSTRIWTITDGTTNVRRGAVKLTVSYTLSTGGTYSVSRNIYMYMPRRNATVGVGGAYQYKTSLGNEPITSATVLLAGLHKVGGGNRSMWTSTTNSATDTSLLIGMPSTQPSNNVGTWDSGNAYYDTYFNTNSGYSNAEGDGYNTSWSAVSTSGGGAKWCGRDRGDSTDKTFDTGVAGQITVDKSRNTTMDTIPFLQGGLFIHYNVYSGEEAAVNYGSDDDALRIGPVDDGFSAQQGESHPSAGAVPYHVSGVTPSATTTYAMVGRFRYRRSASSSVQMNIQYYLTVFVVDKSGLRGKVNEAVGKGYRADQLSVISTWASQVSTLNARILESTTVLGNPEATASMIATAQANLDSALTTCVNTVESNAPTTVNASVANMRGAAFYVPETIYLSASDSKSGQYFYGLTSTGAVDSSNSTPSEHTSALVYWKLAGATSIRITAKLSSNAYYPPNLPTSGAVITNGITSMTVSGVTSASPGTTGWSVNGDTFNQSLTAITLATAMTRGMYKFIEWTATYVYNGAMYQQVAYTAVFAGGETVALQGFHLLTASKSRNRAIMNSAVWMSGFHYMTTFSGDSMDISGNYSYAYKPTDTSVNPKNGDSESPGNSDTLQGCYVTGGRGYDGYWWKDGGSSDGEYRVRTGNWKPAFVLDSTRFNDLSQIPQFQVGLDIFENWGGSDGDGRNTWSVGYSSSRPYAQTRLTNLLAQQTSEGYSNRPSGRVFSSSDVTVSPSSSETYYWLQAFTTSRNSGYEVQSNLMIPFTVKTVNKGSLRTACWYFVRNEELPLNWYTTAEQNAYKLQILTNFMALEVPGMANTTTLVTPELTQANRPTGSISVTHRTIVSGNAQIDEAESMDYKYGDDIYSYYNTITGYVFSNWGGSWGDLGVVQSVTKNDRNWFLIKNVCQWNGSTAVQNPGNKTIIYYYSPKHYNVSYDLGATTNIAWSDSTNAGSQQTITFASSATFDASYTVKSAPVRPGYTFDGWLCSANNLTYQAGATISPWKFDDDVTFTAQWTANSYLLHFDNEFHIEQYKAMYSGQLDSVYTQTISGATVQRTISIDENKPSVTLQAKQLNPASSVGNIDMYTSYSDATDYTMALTAGKRYRFTTYFMEYDVNGDIVTLAARLHPRTFLFFYPSSSETGNGSFIVCANAESVGNVASVLPADFRLRWDSIRGEWEQSFTFTAPEDAPYMRLRLGLMVPLVTDGTDCSAACRTIVYSDVHVQGLDDTYSAISAPSFLSSKIQTGSAYSTAQSTGAGTAGLPTMTRIGYTFTGWRTAKNGGTAISATAAFPYPAENDGTGQWQDAVLGSASMPDDGTGHQYLYPSWSSTSYTITFDVNKPVTAPSAFAVSNGNGSSKTYRMDDAAFTIGAAALTGYTFNGWKPDGSGNWGTTAFTALTVNPGDRYGNVTLTAQWTAIHYTITYDLNKPAGAPSSATPEYGANRPTTYTVEAQTTVSPCTLTGYAFNGWTTQGDGAVHGWQSTTGTGNLVAAKGSYGDVRLTAKWAAKLYAITYDLSRPSQSPFVPQNDASNPASYSIESSVTIKPAALTGFSFDGWTPSGEGASHGWGTAAFQSKTVAAGSFGDVTLTANWRAVRYTITYALARPSNAPSDAVVCNPAENPTSYDVTAAFTIKPATLTGYTFTGWMPASSVSGSGWGSSTFMTRTFAHGSVFGNVTLTASWSSVMYTITFVLNRPNLSYYDPSNLSNLPSNMTSKTYDVESTLSINEPSLVGYTFTGWTPSGSDLVGWGTEPFLSKTLTAGDYRGNVTLTAGWTPIVYSITYDLNKPANAPDAIRPSDSGSNPLSYTIEDEVTVKPALMRGYTFVGWTVSGDGAAAEHERRWSDSIGGLDLVTDRGCYGDVSLQADWTLNMYRITYVLSRPSDAPYAPSNPNTKTSYNVSEAAFTILPASMIGYTFNGWTPSINQGWGTTAFTGKTVYPGECTGDVTLTASWSLTRYDIGYVLAKPDSASASVINPNASRISYTIQDTFTIAPASYPGYTFKGWMPSEGEGRDHGWGTAAFMSKKIESGSYGSITLTALWEKPVHTHVFTVSSTTEPTCVDDGAITYVCDCGETYSESIPALGHAWSEGVVTTEPTCVSEGEMTYECERCSATMSEVIEINPDAHNWSEWIYEDENTHVRHCANDASHTECMPHAFTEWTVTLSPTTEAEGEEMRFCVCCTASETRTVPKLPAQEDPAFFLSGGTARTGETIRVTVSVQNNPGFVSTVLRLSYDPQVFTLIDVKNGDVFSDSVFQPGGDLNSIPFGTSWVSALSDNNTTNGTLVTFIFLVAEDAPLGRTTMTMTYDAKSTFDAQLKPVQFAVDSGSWEILQRMAGDPDGDGEVTLRDAVSLIRSIVGGWSVSVIGVNGDVNRDGRVDLRDAVLIVRFITGGWGVILR